MRVLGICGSPRKGGNSDIVLERFLAGTKENRAEVEKIYLCDLDISPCQECGGCDETGVCIVHDDMEKLFDKISAVNHLIVASPIFFTNLSAQTKTFIDRFQCFWIAKYVLKKPRVEKQNNKKGYFIAVGGQNEIGHYQCSEKVIKAFFAVINFQYEEGIYFPAVDERNDVLKHKDKLIEIFNRGKTLL
ncbi:MAG: flavodoxin family protein [Actinomycetia bacterium]|nr:flavodoxin family protein [Actinomycetes bacterium]